MSSRPRNKPLRVVVKRVNVPPVVEEIPDGYAAVQQIIGGTFDCLFWDERSCLYVNDEGLIKNLPGNIVAPKQMVPMTVDGTLRGNLLAIGYSDRTGDSRSLTNDQVNFFMDLFHSHQLRSL